MRILLTALYPNPFNNELNISVNLSSDSNVSISLFDIRGREIKRIIKEKELSGAHTYRITTESVPDGIYLLKIISNSKIQTQKIIKR